MSLYFGRCLLFCRLLFFYLSFSLLSVMIIFPSSSSAFSFFCQLEFYTHWWNGMGEMHSDAFSKCALSHFPLFIDFFCVSVAIYLQLNEIGSALCFRPSMSNQINCHFLLLLQSKTKTIQKTLTHAYVDISCSAEIYFQFCISKYFKFKIFAQEIHRL